MDINAVISQFKRRKIKGKRVERAPYLKREKKIHPKNQSNQISYQEVIKLARVKVVFSQKIRFLKDQTK